MSYRTHDSANRNQSAAELGIGCSHAEIHVDDLAAARKFYAGQLELEILQESPELQLLAVRAGAVRVSIFGGKPREGDHPCRQRVHLIFQTADLDTLVGTLSDRGVKFELPVHEAPGFCRDVTTLDPDGNRIKFAEYLRDPLSVYRSTVQ